MNDPRVTQLVEDLLESGGTPEEACVDCPELLGDVRESLRRCRSIGERVDALFPPQPGSGTSYRRGVPATAAGELPRIPGYEVESVLGRGGMGVVYRARQLNLKRRVALKMILAGAYATRAELGRLSQEAEAIASLRHAHIVQVYDVGEHEGLPYFTMEYLEGGHLGRKLVGTPQKAMDAAGLVSTLARAVQVAHDAGIVHRDLKPENVLLTAEGTPKITDFGLARHFDEDREATIAGGRVGTPSYMAPEQAGGRPGAVGPSADIYSLGAMLYELLTGRPPFRAETASETVRQVIHLEPASPSRLNARVPRDLETICLKCLAKEPERRYSSASALADDLDRFREGLPIVARPLGWSGRVWRWSRRKPAAAALLLTIVASFATGLGGWLWLERQRADARATVALQQGREWQAIDSALEQAEGLEQQGRWSEARAALAGLPTILGASAPAGLAARLREGRADALVGAELEEVRLRLSEGKTPDETIDRLYGAALGRYGIDPLTPDAAAVAVRVRRSAVRQTLLVFLHDWYYWARGRNRDQLGAVLERADDDPWRRDYRSTFLTKDVDQLRSLARAPQAAAQAPVILSGLGGLLIVEGQREDAWALLREAQRRHPGDFWINYLLARFLVQDSPHEALGYLRAALAVRPNSDLAYSMLGHTLRDTGDADGAIAAFYTAIALNPIRAGAYDLMSVLAPLGRLEEARVAWGKILAGDPPDYEPWYGYAQLCLFLGDEPAYRRARDALFDRFSANPAGWVVAERTSLAGMLLPETGAELERATALADRAVAMASKSPDKDSAYLQFLQGLSAYRRGHYSQAIPLLRKAAVRLPSRAGPGLVLAMAQFRSGSQKEARATLAVAVRNYNWMSSRADRTTIWVSHVLRREAEAMIVPNVTAFLRGEYQPTDDDERFALLGACQSRDRTAAAARLFAALFASRPGAADDLTAECFRRAVAEIPVPDQIAALNTECRYLAARCAALAGCGAGADAGGLVPAERARFRVQAREWLGADLAAWSGTLDVGDEPARALAKRMLACWLAEADLKGVRERDALSRLPAEEREHWVALWARVRGMLDRTADAW